MGSGRTAEATAQTMRVIDVIRHLMEERHLSQSDVERRTGIPKTTLSKLLRGRSTFTLAHLLTLAECLSVQPSELLRAAGL